jgi:hypothetical protein
MERKRALVAYGDIHGFSSWIKRPANSPEEVDSLMEDVSNEFQKFAVESKGYSKYMGDGIMVILELGPKNNSSLVIDFMRRSCLFVESVNKVIHAHWPRPHGFRLRLVLGYVYKKVMLCRNCLSKPSGRLQGQCAEFIGYPINLSQRILHVEPNISLLCHESVKQIIGKKRCDLILKKIPIPRVKAPGIDRDDLRSLHSVKLNSKWSEIKRC